MCVIQLDCVLISKMWKCKVLTFNIKKSSTNYDYKLNNISIESVYSFVDLGITFDSKPSFNSHIEKITNKAFLNLGFISRT